jgi:hypothetical protein
VQILEALESQHRDRLNYTLAKRSANATCAEFKVNTLSELIESGYMHGIGKQTESAITVAKQALEPTVQVPVAIHQFRAPSLADCIEAYTAIKQAQTQTVQEPLAWCTKSELENMAKGFSQDVPARSMRVPQIYPKEGTVLLCATQPAQPAPVTLISSERHIALREAFAINSADLYFEANPTHDNDVGRMLFERGFARGFDSHESAIETAKKGQQ